MHDPRACVKQLRQVLAADKLSVGFFLGAGCPCSIRVPAATGNGDRPLVPAIAGLTEIVSNRLSASPELSAPFGALSQTFEKDKHDDPNVEDMLSRIRILRVAAGTESARGLSGHDLQTLDQAICRIISNTADRPLPRPSTPYHALGRLASGYRTPPLEIFTTNYDLLAEQALESLRIPFFDGFVGSSRPFFDQRAIEDDNLPDRWARLWKLHGSINWRFNRETKQISRTRDESDGDELLIHPSHRKYDESRRMPYVVMIDRLKAFLRNAQRPVALVVVGHSFSDQHLNETLIDSVRANPSAACFALQFENLSKYATAASLAKEEPSLTILARDGAIIRQRPGQWLPQSAVDLQVLHGAFAPQEEPAEQADQTATVKRPCRFVLGDFGVFGRFLDDVTGYGATVDGDA